MNAKHLGALAATASLVAVCCNQPAPAQPSDQAEVSSSTGLEEVIVTARRREERAQSVPISIRSLTQETISEEHLTNMNVIQSEIPALNVFGTRDSAEFVTLRAVPHVILYFDGVPQLSSQFAQPAGAYYGSGNATFDLANFQVLKGPQGTLFGLNATGGAILEEPNKPTNSFEGYLQEEVGDYGHESVESVINVPVIDDKLLVRLGGIYYHTDGYVHDLITQKDLQNDDHWIGRASVTWRPTEDFENDIVFNYYFDHSNGRGDYLYAVNPTGLVARIFPNALALLAQQQALGPYNVLGSGIPGGAAIVVSDGQVIDTAKWDITDSLTLKNIASYDESTLTQRTDTLTLPIPILWQDTTLPQPIPGNATYTEEAQVIGRSFDDKLSWNVGGFLLFGHNFDRQTLPTCTITLGSTSCALATGTGSRTQALYAQGTYDLSSLIEGLHFTAGYRYTWDWRSSSGKTFNGKGVQTALTAQDGGWHAPGYNFSLDYQVTPGTLVYVTDSKAYTSGAFNSPSLPANLQTVNPEYVTQIEVGVKSDWTLWGIKARTNAAYFHSDYQNIQTNVVVAYTDAAGPHLTQVTQNAAKAHIDGVEFDGTFLPFKGFEIGEDMAYQKPKYDKYVSNGVDLSSSPFQFVSAFKWAGHVRYTLPIDSSYGDVSIMMTYAWQSHLTGLFPENTYLQNLASFGTSNLNIDWRNVFGRSIDASFYISNVFNNQTAPGGIDTWNEFGVWEKDVADPRMFGFRLRYRFGPGLDPTLGL